MTEGPPRLLLAIPDRPGVAEAVRTRLPHVPSAFWEGSDPKQLDAVEAVLLGSIAREARGWDPRSSPKLVFVQRVFTGVDDLAFDRFPPEVEIAGNVGGYAPFVAEHAVALALAAARSLVTAHAQVAAGRLRPPPENRPLLGRTAVILGYGEIGRAIAARLRGFEVRIVAVTRSGTPEEGCLETYGADRLLEALPRGDIVFDARPLTRRTQRTIGTEELRAMPKNAIFVNVGRAGTVDEEALYRHLVEHPPFRAALDVWWDERYRDGSLPLRFPFPTLPNLVATPHSAAFAPGVELYALGKALENLARYFSGERPRHLVDRTEYVGLG